MNVSDKYEALATEIIELVIEASLLKMMCAEDEEHSCLGVWSPNAAEQIGTKIRNAITKQALTDKEVVGE